MTTQVEKTIEVDVPVRSAYDQWTQFEEFPQFMGGVQEVRQVSDSLTHWVAEIAGVRREWDAAILEQVPDQKVAWAATTGATNAGAVYFQPLGAGRTLVRLSLEYEPEGLVEKIGDFLNVVERQAEGDLERFKSFIESRGTASGGWRGAVNEAGTVGTPGVESASASRGDSGKAGVSGTAVAAGVAAAGAAVAGAAAAMASKRSGEEESHSGRASDVEGDVVEIGSTGSERSTLDTTAPTIGATGGVSAPTFDDEPGGGDPVAVADDPAPLRQPDDYLDRASIQNVDAGSGIVDPQDLNATPGEDRLAVDEFGTVTAGVNGGTTGIPIGRVEGAAPPTGSVDPADPSASGTTPGDPTSAGSPGDPLTRGERLSAGEDLGTGDYVEPYNAESSEAGLDPQDPKADPLNDPDHPRRRTL